MGVNKSTAGIVTLSGANTYTGATAVNAGTLRLGAANRIADASALTVASGATFDLNSLAETVGSIAGAGSITLGTAALVAGGDGTSTTFSGAISGTGGLTKTGAGMLTLSGTNVYTGATTISAGTLRASGGSAIADTSAVTLANIASAALDLSASETVGTLSGGGAAGGNLTLNANTLTVNQAANATYSGIASGTGGITKQGANTLTLSGANTYTGITTVTAGTLALGASNVLANASSAVVNGGTLALAANSDTMAGVQLLSGSITSTTGVLTSTSNYDLQSGTVSAILAGAVGVNKSTAGAVTLSGANTYTGATAVNAGTLTLGANNVLANASTVVVNGGTLSVNTRTDTVAGVQLLSGSITGTTGVLSSTTAYDLQSGSVSAILAGAVGLNKTTPGTVTLAGANTFTGATNVADGTLIAGNAAALGTTATGTTVANGATLQIANVAIGAEAVTLNGAGVGGAGALVGTGNASLAGGATLGPGTFVAAPAASDSLTLAGAVNGAQALTQSGAGSVTFASSVGSTTPLASFTSNPGSTTRVNGGLLRTTGAQVYDGALNIGAPATLQTAGSSIIANGAVTATAGTLTFAAGAGSVTMTNSANDFATVAVVERGGGKPDRCKRAGPGRVYSGDLAGSIPQRHPHRERPDHRQRSG